VASVKSAASANGGMADGEGALSVDAIANHQRDLLAAYFKRSWWTSQ
jgi:hypothetical protein